MSNNTTMSIFAEALINNREYKNARVNGEAVGVANARTWSATVKALRLPAYAIRVFRYNHMGDTETVAPCDMAPLFTNLVKVVDMIGAVNGAKLSAQNLAEEIISNAVRFRVIDITPEMAHARCDYREARKAMNENDTEENTALYEQCKAEVERLEALPGNCKRIPEVQSESAFVKAVEILLGDAIKKQTMKSAEEVAAEEEAKRQARKARKQAKKQAATSTEATTNA